VRQFGRIETAIWQTPKFRALSERGQRLYLYLIACPHGNAIGCFRLPYGYAEEDLAWPRETLLETLSELLANGLATYNERLSIVRLAGWFGHNVIENRNVGRGAVKTLGLLPHCEEKVATYHALREACAAHIEELRNDFETVAKGFANPCQPKEPEPEPEPEIKPEPEKETGAASAPDLQPAVAAWNELAVECDLSRVQVLTDTRKRSLAQRLEECGGIEGWRVALGKVRSNPFLRGKNKQGWKASFDFLLQQSSFTKLMEDGYAGGSPQGGNGFIQMARERSHESDHHHD
jgi:hypothetical protein